MINLFDMDEALSQLSANLAALIEKRELRDRNTVQLKRPSESAEK